MSRPRVGEGGTEAGGQDKGRSELALSLSLFLSSLSSLSCALSLIPLSHPPRTSHQGESQSTPAAQVVGHDLVYSEGGGTGGRGDARGGGRGSSGLGRREPRRFGRHIFVGPWRTPPRAHAMFNPATTVCRRAAGAGLLWRGGLHAGTHAQARARARAGVGGRTADRPKNAVGRSRPVCSVQCAPGTVRCRCLQRTARCRGRSPRPAGTTAEAAFTSSQDGGRQVPIYSLWCEV